MAVLQRRGVQSQEELQSLLQPDPAPEAKAHFPDLECAVQRLLLACREGQALAVCGDYDADGMTSTALLVGVLSRLGAKPQAAIPSRQSEGYGLNAAMVERLAEQGVKLLVTVDNGISAREALERAEALGLEVIVTDHHTIPPQRPPLLALLHPALTPPSSPYRGLAGVGLAYVLAAAVAERLRNPQALRTALDLFCIGTIADMAPLTGVNRRWLQEGLPQLHRSALPGLRALAELSGLEDRPIDSQGVGFRLAPRLNAVGRLADPQLAVELLTTSDADRALELAERCEQLNRQRRELCDGIEAEANALVEADGDQRPAFLLLAQNHWHHGVIGIVAARLVERWGLPVALLAGEGNGRLRSSVRAPEGFAVDAALSACSDLLERFGGHPAAGGFTVQATEVAALHERLNGLANDWLAGRDMPWWCAQKRCCHWIKSTVIFCSSCAAWNRLAPPTPARCSGRATARSNGSDCFAAAICCWSLLSLAVRSPPSLGVGVALSPAAQRWIWPFASKRTTGRGSPGCNWNWRPCGPPWRNGSPSGAASAATSASVRAMPW